MLAKHGFESMRIFGDNCLKNRFVFGLPLNRGFSFKAAMLQVNQNLLMNLDLSKHPVEIRIFRSRDEIAMKVDVGSDE